MIVVDAAGGGGGGDAAGGGAAAVAPLEGRSDAGIPVVVVKRATAEPLFTGAHRARLDVRLDLTLKPAYNIVGRIVAGAADKLAGTVLVGAHYDHLGMGGPNSLAPDAHEVHNGADDNASGTAALLEAARTLEGRRGELARDVEFVAFSGEESGVLGSTHFVHEPPAGFAVDSLVAMINMDMVGRMRGDKLSVLGGESAAEWQAIVPPACEREGILCTLGGDGYGPSDQTPFYAAGVPVLHLFTGTHADYHKPSDDTDKINAAGGAQVAALAADLAAAVASRPGRLTYVEVPPPPPDGDTRSFGASLGTIPDYAGPPGGAKGVLLAGVRPGSPAEEAGIRRGDILVGLAGKEIGDIYDFVYVLRAAKPGQQATAVVVRDGARVELPVTFGANSRIR